MNVTFASFLLGLCLFIGQVAPDDQECLYWENSFYNDGFCYRLFKIKKTWDKSNTDCRGNFPYRRLAELRTDDVAKVVRTKAILMESDHFNAMDGIWLGGYYDNETDASVWSSGALKNISLSSHHWVHPTSNPNGLNLMDRQCVYLAGSFRLLSLQSCSLKAGYLCEEYVGHPCGHLNHFPRYYDGQCFLLSHDKETWPKAQNVCRSFSFELAEPASTEYMDFIRRDIVQGKSNLIAVPQESSVNVSQHDVHLGNKFNFLLQSCGEATMVMHGFEIDDQKSTGSQVQKAVVRLHMDSEYVTIALCEVDASTFALSCIDTQSQVIGNGPYFNPCHHPLAFSVIYDKSARHVTVEIDSTHTFLLRLPSTWIGYHFTTVVLSINDDGPGQWYFAGMIDTVYLGATNKNPGGEFVWVNSGQVVDFPKSYWHTSEPSNATEENHLEISGLFALLNDVNGELNRANVLCQWDQPLQSHVIIVPHDTLNRQLHITSDSHTMVVFHGKFLGRNFVVRELDALSSGVSNTHPFKSMNITSLVSSYEPDSSESFLLIQSTDEVTVIMYSVTQQNQLYSQFFYPNNVLFVRYIVYPYGELYSFKIVYIALEEGETSVKVTSDDVNVETRLNQYQANSTVGSKSGSGVLMCADRNIAVFSVAYLQEDSTDVMAFSYQPADSLSNFYITIPSLPIITPLPAKSNFRYAAVAAYADTTITIGQNNADYTDTNGGAQTGNVDATQSWTLAKEGDIEYITLDSSQFLPIYGTKPFYLTKEASGIHALDNCPTPFIPSHLWKTSYDFTVSKGIAKFSKVYIVIIYLNNLNFPLLNGSVLNASELECPAMTGASVDYKTCYFRLDKGTYHMQMAIQGTSFMLYMVGMQEDRPFCHPLGVKSSATVRDNDFECESYRKIQPSSTQSSGSVSTSKPIADQTTVNSDANTASTGTTNSPQISLSSTSSVGQQAGDVTTDVNINPSTTAMTDLAVEPTPDVITGSTSNPARDSTPTSSGHTPTTLVQPTTIQTVIQTTSSTGPPAEAITPINEVITDSRVTDTVTQYDSSDYQYMDSFTRPTSDMTDSSTGNQITDPTTTGDTSENPGDANGTCVSTSQCQCSVIDLNKVNQRTNDAIKKLRVPVSQTSAYRRSKTSASDSRVSALITGLAGVAIFVSFVFLIIVPDVVSVMRQIHANWQHVMENSAMC